MKDKELRDDIKHLVEALSNSNLIRKRENREYWDDRKYASSYNVGDMKNQLDALCEYLGLEFYYEPSKKTIRKIPKQKKIPSGFKLIDTL